MSGSRNANSLGPDTPDARRAVHLSIRWKPTVAFLLVSLTPLVGNAT
jgi:hypothetical protein